MSEELEKRISKVIAYFNGFTNYFELEDFRSFLLFTLTSQTPANILAQLGMGGSKETINLPYDPDLRIYYQKINLIASGALIVYVKRDPINNKFILEKDNPIFKEFLNANEMSLAFRGKEKFLFPNISDCTSIDADSSKLSIIIDDYFYSLESFLAILEPNILFVIDAKDPAEPDLIFTFNMMPEFPGKLKEKVFKIDVFLDKDHKMRDITYLKREEDYKLTFMKDIKEISHTELYKSAFSLIIHIKSLNRP